MIRPAGVREWVETSPADIELALVEALFAAATGKRKVDTQAAKFLLANLWPKRWGISPHPAKASPLDDDDDSLAASPEGRPEAPHPASGQRFNPGVPFSMKLHRA